MPSSAPAVAPSSRVPWAALALAVAGVFLAPSSASAWQPRPGQGGAAVRLPQPPAEAIPNTPEATLGYALGLQIGGRMRDDFNRPDAGVDLAALVAGLGDAILGRPPRLDEEKSMAALTAYEQKLIRQRQDFERRMAEVAKTNLAKGTEYLAANRAKKGVVTLPSGLQYEVLVEGRGPQPTDADVVSTSYRGTHLDGTVFDATEPGKPATFPVTAVVPGWQEALALMKVGSKWRITLPAELGYGEAGSLPVIEPNEVLVFELELLGIEPPAAPPRR